MDAVVSTPKRRFRQTKAGAATRELILREAQRLFAAKGFAGVSMPTLAQACGITAGAIYKHFASKEQLFFEVVRRAVESAPVTTGAEGPAGIPASIAAYTTRRLKLVRQFAIELHYAAAKDAKVLRLLRMSVDRDIERIAEAIAEGQTAGVITATDDPTLLASLVMTFVMGLMHGETMTPSLVGDAAWQATVEVRLAAMLGLK
jgi:AcrR family transcriptional regulator